MDAEERIYAALAGLPCDVCKPPGDGTLETYVLVNESLGMYTAYASNQPQREMHLYQVHVYSKKTDGTYRAIMRQAIALLQADGIRVRTWGPDDFETDTGYHHITITCGWRQTIA